ncbi:MAG: hypothetical protein VX777_09975 [Chlamydiota bacterium]|nr:hypothetical protein [Chlamydiota bacterium]
MRKHVIFTMLALIASTALLQRPLLGVGVNIITGDGTVQSLDVDPETSIRELLSFVQTKGQNVHFEFWDTSIDGDDELVCKAKQLRDYYAPVTAEIEEDMKFIVITLGNEPLLKLKKYKDDLKKAGDRLDEVHPLHFWRVIFTDEKATSAMHNIKRRKKVWKSFIKGMGQSLEEACDRDNLKTEYLEDFANKVDIDVNVITKPIQKRDWSEFAKQLLINVSRNGNIDRYDQ